MLLCIGQTHFGSAEPGSATVFPNRWNFPSRFEYTASFNEHKLDGFDFTLYMDKPAALEVESNCYTDLGNGVLIHTPGTHSATRVFNVLKISAAFQERQLKEITVFCERVRLRHDDGPSSETDREVSFLGSFLDTSQNHFYADQRGITHQIHNLVSLHHTYTRTDNAQISVLFSFFRPPSSSDTEFYMDHPLLNTGNIDTLHSAPSLSLQDRKRLYNLLIPDQIRVTCQHENGNGLTSTAELTIKIIDEVPVTTLNLLDSSTNSPTVCTFTIDYPPDVLRSIPPKAMGITITPKNESNKEVKLTLERLKYLAAVSKNPQMSVPVPITIWTSSSYIRGVPAQVDFGILNAPYYYDADGVLHPNNTPQTINFSVEAIYDVERDIPFDTTLLDISYSCNNHSSDEESWKEQSETIGTPLDLKVRFAICQVQIKPPENLAPEDTPDVIRITMNRNNMIDSMPITVFNAFHQPTQQVPHLTTPLRRVNEDTMRTFPGLTHIPLSYTPRDASSQYATVKLGVHYAHHHRAFIKDDPDKMYLLLIFPQYLSIHEIIADIDDRDWTANITSRGYNVTHVVQTDFITSPSFASPIIENPDPLDTILQYGRPIRSPYLRIPLDVILDPAQPLEVTVKFPVLVTDTTHKFEVFGILLPTWHALFPTYTPLAGHVTPIRSSPLTGYSYRCVNWDNMAASYIHRVNGNQSFPPLTALNSFPCPSHISRDTGLVDVSDPAWKRIEFLKGNSVDYHHCFYELAAVCVTPSKTTPNAYNIHPLVECRSFLGTTHAIPCSMIDDIDNHQIALDVPYVPVTVSSENGMWMLNLEWNYAGDARNSLHLSIRALKTDSDSSSDNATTQHTPWVSLAPDVPANLGKISTPIPFYNPFITKLQVQMTLNAAPFTTVSFDIDVNLQDGSEHPIVCPSEESKVFDIESQLCVCNTKDGYMSSTPEGVNPDLLYPHQFTCHHACEGRAGLSWNPTTMQCEMETPPDVLSECHDIPEGITPPFRTKKCGYGIATNAQCENCACFSAWEMGKSSSKCLTCRLENLCHSNNTHPSTFKPEYCALGRCLCRQGFSGSRCQYKVIYGTLNYHKPATDEQQGTLSPSIDYIIPRKQRELLEERLSGKLQSAMGGIPAHVFIQQAIQRLSKNRSDVVTTIMVALARFEGQTPLATSNRYISDTWQATGLLSSFALGAQADDGSFDDLYSAWEHMQQNISNNNPITIEEDYGMLDGIGAIYDPHCVPNAYTYCPPGRDEPLPPEKQVDEDEVQTMYKEPSDKTTLYIILGVVLGSALILFILLISSIVYCRKHEKACFRKRKAKGAAGSKAVGSHTTSNGLELTMAPSHSSQPPPFSSTVSSPSSLPTQVDVNDPTLPDNWVALRDQNTGEIYYSNKITMESSWDHPCQPSKKPKSAYGW